ncbi:MAG: hypothetical protein R3324_06525, partial [Halobacteriales archaeon]|nr:hypothetical protein [Halobacteriales archaeon]
VGLLWLAEALPASLSNTKPASVAEVGLPANVIHVLDLGFVVPAALLTAWWLHQGKPWGYVLAGVIFVKVISISLAVLGMIAWMTTHGEPVALAELAIFGLITVLGAGVGAVYFRSLRHSTGDLPGDDRPGAASR